jgi:hypothetical protein
MYDKEIENWRILTIKENYAVVKTHYNKDNKVKYFTLFGHVQRTEENRIGKKVLYEYTTLEATRLRGGPRNRWKDEVREYGRLVGGKGWKERIPNREEWKKLLRTARNRRILHMPME